MVSKEPSALVHAYLHRSRRCLRPLRGDRSVGIVESNGVVTIEVEKARTQPLEPDYNVGKLSDPKRLVSGTERGTNPCSGWCWEREISDSRLREQSTQLPHRTEATQQRHRIHMYYANLSKHRITQLESTTSSWNYTKSWRLQRNGL